MQPGRIRWSSPTSTKTTIQRSPITYIRTTSGISTKTTTSKEDLDRSGEESKGVGKEEEDARIEEETVGTGGCGVGNVWLDLTIVLFLYDYDELYEMLRWSWWFVSLSYLKKLECAKHWKKYLFRASNEHFNPASRKNHLRTVLTSAISLEHKAPI